jgi:hypothetical protein
MGRYCFTNWLGVDPLIVIAVFLAALFIVLVFNVRLYHNRLLAICPKVIDSNDRLVARTSWIAWFLMLTLLSRKVVVDAKKHRVFIKRRLFWFCVSIFSIPFDQIEKISYNYEDWGPFTGVGLTGNTKDCFSVNLQLVNGEDVHLFNFLGEGTFEARAPNPLLSFSWYWAKMLLAFSGSQEDDSRRFVDRLEELIGAPVSP